MRNFKTLRHLVLNLLKSAPSSASASIRQPFIGHCLMAESSRLFRESLVFLKTDSSWRPRQMLC